MLAWLRRWQLRRLLSPLLEGDLPPQQVDRLRHQIATDPVLADEVAHLEAVLTALRSVSDAPVPEDLRRELHGALAITDKPLRQRYSQLLDRELDEPDEVALRSAIEADPELQAEFSLIAAAIDTARTLPDAPLPVGFRAELDRRLESVAPLPARAFATPALLVRAAVAATVVIGAGLAVHFARGSDPAPAAPAVTHTEARLDRSPVIETVTPHSTAVGEAREEPSGTAEQPSLEPHLGGDVAPADEGRGTAPTRVAIRAPTYRPTWRRHGATRSYRPRTSRAPRRSYSRTVPRDSTRPPSGPPTPSEPKPEETAALAAATQPRADAAARILETVMKSPPRPRAMHAMVETDSTAGPGPLTLVRLAPPVGLACGPTRPQIPDPVALNTPEPAAAVTIELEPPVTRDEAPADGD